MSVLVIINPAAGKATRSEVVARSDFARAVLARRGLETEVVLTAGPGDAYRFARAAAGSKHRVVVAWGGDGTMNEVGSALAFTSTEMGLIPAGSGNGLARALGISRDARTALDQIATGGVRAIDVGELAGRLFFNIAGIGFDGHVAAAFNTRPPRSRGPMGYLATGVREFFAYVPNRYYLTAQERTGPCDALLLAIANSCEYGNGARIAPGAVTDDGLLDLVVLPPVGFVTALRRLPALFAGRVLEVPGVFSFRTSRLTIEAERELEFHIDGEPGRAPGPLHVTVHPRALRVRVPDPRVL